MEKITVCSLDFIFPKCHPGNRDFYGKVVIKEDITDLLPYINGYLGNHIEKPKYCQNINWIKFTFRGFPDVRDTKKQVAIKEKEVKVTIFNDADEAKTYCSEAIDFLNHIIASKDQITPSYREWNPPKPLDIYNKLKKTNCKECGQPTCMSFAMKLIQENANFDDCPYLVEDKKALLEVKKLF